MLNSLRTFVGSWVAKILLVLLVGSFALWGISGSLLSQGDINTVATVGETKIPARDFLAAYSRNIAPVEQQAARRITREEARAIGVEQRSLSDVVAFATLDEYARRAGLALSEDTLAREIASNPAFQNADGNFSRDLFTRAVYNARMRESDFIKSQNQASIRGQLTSGFAAGQILPDALGDAVSQFANEARQFDYVTIRPTVVVPALRPEQAALNEYFASNTAAYRAPEYRNLDVLELSPELIADENAINDEDITADYEARRASYDTPETRRLEQVVFADREKAQEVLTKVEGGLFFKAAVEEAGLTLNDLGTVVRSSLPDAVGDAAFSLGLNEVSDVIDGPFGPTLLRVTEVQAGSTRSLEEVSAEIRADLALRLAADRINDLFEAVEDARAGGRGLADIAAEFDLNVQNVGWVDSQSRNKDGAVVSDVPGSQEVLQRAFQTEVGLAGSAVEPEANEYVWFDVLGIEEARDRTLEETQERVIADWQRNQRAEDIAERAKVIETRLKAGETLFDVAKSEGLNVQKTDLLKRNDQADAFSREVVLEGFNGGEGHIFTHQLEGDTGKIVAKVARVTEEGEPLAEAQLDQLNQAAADDLLNQLIARLQDEYAVTQNPQAVDYALTQGR